MAILKIAVLGNPILRVPAEPVKNIKAPEIQRLIDDMLESMEESHGVGLAAPQVHRALQIVTIDAEEEGNPITVSPTILINPRIVPATERMEEGWEGCLSVPDIRGKVPRYAEVDVEAFDRRGKRLQFHAVDFFARVIQHECDHLDGHVYLDRMADMRTLAFVREFEDHVAHAHEEDEE